MDYPGGELILQPRNKASLEQLEQRAKAEKQIVVPFWMAGDHFMVSWGRVSKGAPVLLFVDTGLAGGGYTGPRSVLDEAGVKVSEEHASEGVGGGGKMKIVPFLEVCEAFAASRGLEKLVAGVNTSRIAAYRQMLARIPVFHSRCGDAAIRRPRV